MGYGIKNIDNTKLNIRKYLMTLLEDNVELHNTTVLVEVCDEIDRIIDNSLIDDGENR